MLLLGAASQVDETRPRLREAWLPNMPFYTVGGGQVLLELKVSSDGRVEEVVTLRRTPPFAELLVGSVSQWSFDPGHDAEGPVASRVLLAALFRPPATYQGTTTGEQPENISPGSSEIPYPTTMTPFAYPPKLYEEGMALVEVEVNRDGEVASAKVVAATPGFAEIALDTAREWRFRAARREGQPVEATALILLGFAPPMVS